MHQTPPEMLHCDGPMHWSHALQHVGSAPSAVLVHLPTVTAVMMGDTNRERRTLLVTEKHCWHPDKLLLRLWPSTLRRSEAAEGALQRHTVPRPCPCSSSPQQSSSHHCPDHPSSPQRGTAMTALPAQLRCPQTTPWPTQTSVHAPTSPRREHPPSQGVLGWTADRFPTVRGCGEKMVAWGHAVAVLSTVNLSRPLAMGCQAQQRAGPWEPQGQYLPTHVDGEPDGNDRHSNASDDGDHHRCPQHHAQLPQDLPGS